MGISPTFLVHFDVAHNALMADGILEEDFAKNSKLVVRLVYFLYGREYACSMSRDDRIEAIKKCVDLKSGSRDRLRRLAFSEASDTILFNEGAFEDYFSTASVARMFFAPEDLVGGFPMEAILRYQRSQCCFLVSACVWFTLKLQRDMPNAVDATQPIDVANVARHKLITNNEKLKERVVQNKGGKAFALAMTLTGCGNQDFVSLSFMYPVSVRFTPHVDHLGAMAIIWCEELGPGLVTNFHVPSPFSDASKRTDLPGMGYWKFDADNINCQGDFVELERDAACDDEHDRLYEIWKVQHQRATEAVKQRRATLDTAVSTLFAAADGAGDNESSAADDQDQPAVSAPVSLQTGIVTRPTEAAAHAMVMLGGYTKEIDGEKKSYMMLLNWWKSMPLILVSSQYLQACRATVCFLTEPLTEITTLARKEGSVGECLCPDEGADDFSFMDCFDDDGGDE
jgi:hypothetical protein